MAVNSINGRDGNLFLPRALPDRALAETTASAPTITVTQQATSTIASAQPLVAPNDSRFSYTGIMDFGAVFPDTTLYQPISRYPYTWGSPANWSVSFSTDASVFEILFKYVSTSTLYRLTVNGRKVTDLTQATGAVSVGSRHVLKFDFTTSAPRDIRLDLYTMPFGGVFIGPTATLWKQPFRQDRMIVLGDSFTSGSTQNTGGGNGTWMHRFARLMGYEDIWNSSIGGTGYVADNGGASVPFPTRVVRDVCLNQPDRVLVYAGYNDVLLSLDSISANARAVYAALQTYTDAYIVVVGPVSSTGSSTASQTDTAATIRAACAVYKIPFIDPLTGSIYDANGALLVSTSPWFTTANVAAYIGGDGVHPTDAGHTYLASRMADAYTRLGNP